MNTSHIKGVICGVYEIVNILNGKKYIGSSNNIKNRLRQHKAHLIAKKHHSFLLQRAVNKHGIENFICNFLEICSLENQLDKEQYYLDLFKTYDTGYNIAKSSKNPSIGRGFSKKHLKKLSDSHIGNKIKNKTKLKIINTLNQKYQGDYCLISPSGSICKFNSIIKFSRERGIWSKFVSELINGRRNSYKGWTRGQAARIPKKDIDKKTITLKSPNGVFITRRGIRAFCNEFNLDRGAIHRVLHQKSRTHMGWSL